MIRYTLTCDRDHSFEAWFASSTAYDRAAAADENVCPVCGSRAVEKTLMAPAVSGTKKKGEDAPEGRMAVAAPDPRSAALRQLAREFRRRVTEDADYVGDRFAEEARKIHYNETEARGIYGEATLEEARALNEEGIAFHPLPPVPDDAN
jgi:hypothetical protein